MTSVFEQIHFDSRKVVENTLFICKGINFQSDYLFQAIHAGATGFLMEEKQRKEIDMNLKIPGILVKHSQKAM
ncbi:MAG: UDP-N-acetylmuramoyl-L-alanyl-D-glutamate--lysine ligase, partial [Carnobacterium sp.]